MDAEDTVMMTGRFQPRTFAMARASRQLTLAQLANKTGLSTPTLSRIEQGLRDVAAYEVEVLANAVGYPTATMFETLPSDSLGLPTFYHRKLSAAGERKVCGVEGRCLMASIGLRNLLKLVDPETTHSIPKLDRDDYGGDPEKAASHVRLLWQMPRGPVVNLIEIIERAGGLVIHCDFGVDAMDALYQPAPQLPPLFWMNSNKPFDRARFSLAHELGHVVMHHVYTEAAMAEEEADKFASAFLMPRADFRSECVTRLDFPMLAQLKQRWRVSMAAIVRRAHDLNAISDSQYRSILIRMSNMRKVEPYPISSETPRLLAGLLQKFSEGYGKAAPEEIGDALRIPAELVAEWRQLWPGFGEDDGPPRLRMAF
jgi:Zn-dependent peptidase ImmA (M78 family)/transcriptional regulator with XRE-family HTH domain